jgi:hypothetical protein
MNRRHLCVVGLLAMACTSCGNGLYPVSGKVLFKGQPAAGAAVFFSRQGGDPMKEPLIMGIVQDDGTFSLVSGAQGQGALPGEYDVLIEWKRHRHRARGVPQQSPDRLKGRYADPKRPALHATIKAQTNQLAPFELTD